MSYDAQPTILDWREARHWSPRAKVCRHCGDLTNLRDDAGRPAHKVCADTLLEVAS